VRPTGRPRPGGGPARCRIHHRQTARSHAAVPQLGREPGPRQPPWRPGRAGLGDRDRAGARCPAPAPGQPAARRAARTRNCRPVRTQAQRPVRTQAERLARTGARRAAQPSGPRLPAPGCPRGPAAPKEVVAGGRRVRRHASAGCGCGDRSENRRYGDQREDQDQRRAGGPAGPSARTWHRDEGRIGHRDGGRTWRRTAGRTRHPGRGRSARPAWARTALGAAGRTRIPASVAAPDPSQRSRLPAERSRLPAERHAGPSADPGPNRAGRGHGARQARTHPARPHRNHGPGHSPGHGPDHRAASAQGPA